MQPTLFEFLGNHYMLAAAWFAILGMFIFSFFSARVRGYQIITTAVATNMINREDALILDIRADKEYETGHIVNSLHIPQGYVNDRIKEIEKHKDKPIITVCHSGQRSAQVCSILVKQGFDKVYNLKGGIVAWQGDRLPLTKK